jgi:Cu+-exporting ATPase
MFMPSIASVDAVVEAEWREESQTLDLEAQQQRASVSVARIPQLQSVKLSISGMTCASCVATIQRHLEAAFPDWLLACDINLLTESALVRINVAHPDSSVQKIISEIEDVGFSATVQDGGRSGPRSSGNGEVADAARRGSASAPQSGAEKAAAMVAARQASVRHYRQLLLFCLVFAVPVFIMAMVLSYIPVTSDGLMRRVYHSLSLGSLLMWILSSPLQFGVGAIFYRLAWKGLRHRNANMSLLIAIGTSAAYGYALIDVIRALATPMQTDAGAPMDMPMGMPMDPSGNDVAAMDQHGSSSDIGGMGGAMFFETASTLITFIILGRFLEALAKGKTSEALVKLTQMQADVAILLHLDPVTGAVLSEEEVASSSLRVGQLVKVLRGTKVPADGVVTEGSSAVDEAFLTGESLPVHKQTGDDVIGASINQESTLIVRVTRAASESTLANILHLMENAQSGKAPIQKFADRLSGVFVPIVVVLAFLTWLVWFLIATQSSIIPTGWLNQGGANGSRFLFSFLFGLAVVVIACPCALGLATPTAVMVGTGVGASMGVLIKGGSALETAHKVSVFVFDKTGTLTEGKPKVTAVKQFVQLPLARLAFLLGSAEQDSEHVLAKAIVNWAKEELSTNIEAVSATLSQPMDFVATSGKGLTCVVDGSKVAIGNRACMSDAGVSIPIESEQYMVMAERTGAIALAVSIDGVFAAILSLSDPPKLEARSIVQHLTQRMGIEVWMCTGDNVRTAHAVAARVGIAAERVVASALPGDKLELVKRLQSDGHSVGMIGDGINDSPALAQANLGVSVGAGTDVAMETASVVLIRNDLRDLVTALDLSRATLRRIRINFVWALGYNLVGIPIAAGLFYPAVQIRLPPELAALAMALSSVSVICSSLWLKRYRKPVIHEEQLLAAAAGISAAEHAEVELSSLHSGEQEQPLKGHGASVTLQPASSPTALQASVFGQDQHGAFCDCGCNCRRRSKSGLALPNDTAASGRSCCSSSEAPAGEVSFHAVRVHMEEDLVEEKEQGIAGKPTFLQTSAGCACQCVSCQCTLSR